MKEADAPCEICSAKDWKSLGTKVFRRDKSETANSFKQSRLRVLFELWFPGTEQVELSYVACRRCGFVVYFPRPQQEDLDAKYRFLDQFRFSFTTRHLSADSPIAKRRSRVIFDYISQRIDATSIKDVLDYGGDDGRLMQAFLAHGHACYNVDFNPNCIPGVQRLGDTLDDLADDARFDLIICSHVMEHVAEPVGVVTSLIKFLREDGWLFVEVPMEIWRRPPIRTEPVTHVNFYTPNSLGNLLLSAGLHLRESRLISFMHKSGDWYHGIRGLAQRNSSKTSQGPAELLPSDVECYLNPGLSDTIHYYSTCPQALLQKLRRRFT